MAGHLSHSQRVRYLQTSDGLRLAWAEAGSGPPLVRAATWLTHLEYAWDSPVWRQVFTSRFLPQGTDEQIAWFTALCAKASTGAVAGTLLKMRSDIDVTPLLPSVHVPTLVIHARNDQVVPISQGQIIAAGIPNAQFIELDSTNHILLEHEPAWNAFRSAALEFLGAPSGTATTGDDPFAELSTRERKILAL